MKLKKALVAFCSALCVVSMVGASGCGGFCDNSGNGSSNSINGSVDNEIIGTEGLEYTLSEDGTYYSVTAPSSERAKDRV